ncbi:deoxynucleoside triphosphate triphosphohydrolase SAMHD1-like [Crassostrea angulata]|uniref:deoxynucleoside triphosphate triphosphohydrolase SAMHD1-like n=1 Tax=Magallana angulata TaxID=2784310 RepID=UPI0022B0FA13|nr:deoxynucleoside triphosphate triphosphohydrolase SAMHD1-like [Crassostrea angulata]
MKRKDNKRKTADPTETTKPKRRKPEQKHKPSRAVESSGDQPSPSSQVPRDPGPSQSPAGQPRSEDASTEQQADSETGKIFNDPIHGHIEIPPLCVKIIDTPQFQRLRSIKQLGGTYFVYPGASHNRFEHSIGVCHLAGQLASALQTRQPDLGITNEDVLCVQIAGLCHDLGHGPFSHMFDNKFLPSTGSKIKHESLSVKMFNYLVTKNNLDKEFKRYFGKNLAKDKHKTFITEMIEGPPKTKSKGWQYKGRNKEKSFLYEIVANKRNGIDVDKWDYFARDCHMLGIKNSFDHTRCMKFARVVEVKGEKQICFRDKEAANLYEMFHTRYILHRRAYQHKVGNIIEIMISEAMKEADEHILTPRKKGTKLRISETCTDMSAYETLTDSIVDRILWSEDANLDRAKRILENIRSRNLYKCVGHTIPPNKMDEKDVRQKYLDILKEKSSGLSENDVIIDVVNFNYGKKDKNPIDHVCFYTKKDPNKADKRKMSEVSGLLPKKFEEQEIRFYCKKDDDTSLKEASIVFQDFKDLYCP